MKVRRKKRKALPRAYSKPAEVIKSRLDKFKARAERAGFSANVLAFMAPDGSYEGEARVALPEDADLDTDDILLDAGNWLTVPKLDGLWVSSGARFSPTTHVKDIASDKERSRYDREHGMVSIGSYAQRGTQKASNFLGAREAVTSAEEAFEQRATEIFVRLIWAPEDTKPARRGRPIAKRKKPKRKKKPSRKVRKVRKTKRKTKRKPRGKK